MSVSVSPHTPVGSNPSWVDGYVPPASEWNNLWASKLDVTDSTLVGGPFLSLAGGSMTGLLLLSADATAPLGAVTKQYVDSLTFATGPFMPLSGGTFSGPVAFTDVVTLAANPSAALQAATKQYVDSSTSVANSAMATAQAAVRRTGDTMTGSLVLAADPTAALGAATKQYADKFLPLTGGTVNGRLATTAIGDLVSGRNLYATTNFYVNAYNNWEWDMFVDGSGNHIQQYRAGWYDKWDASTGMRTWFCNNVAGMSLDVNGNLSVANFCTVHNGLNVAAGGLSVTAGGLSVTAGGLTVSAGGLNVAAGGATVTGNISASGGISAGGTVSAAIVAASNNVAAANMVTVSNGNAWFGPGSGSVQLVFAGNWYYFFNTGNGDMIWTSPSGYFWWCRPSDWLAFNNLGAVGGHGAYQNLSDVRGKERIADSTKGLAEIMRLRPVDFQRRRREGDSRPPVTETGFVAQELQQIIPEAVTAMGVELPDGTGGIDSGEPTLGVSLDPIVAALVRAVQTLAARA
jgi:hypothetical protein